MTSLHPLTDVCWGVSLSAVSLSPFFCLQYNRRDNRQQDGRGARAHRRRHRGLPQAEAQGQGGARRVGRGAEAERRGAPRGAD